MSDPAQTRPRQFRVQVRTVADQRPVIHVKLYFTPEEHEGVVKMAAAERRSVKNLCEMLVLMGVRKWDGGGA
ncbi:MAG TPA: hypothetical protein VIV12_27775 [Streptosporangiaceae bacterium]